MNRATMLAAVDDLVDISKKEDQDFVFFVPKERNLEEDEIMQNEYDLLGYFVTKHPLESCSTRVNDLDKIETLPRRPASSSVNIGGLIAECKIITTKKGLEMAFLQVEDLTGRIEVVVFSRTYEKYKHLLKQNALIEIAGKLELKEEEKETEEGIETIYIPKILMYNIKPLEKIGKIERLVISVTKNDDFNLIDKTITEHPGDIPILIEFNNFEIHLNAGYEHSTQALSELQEICMLKAVKNET